eukprot:Nk52_evm24s2309 gene=Nk52_evmTU24s2309
MNSTKTIIDIKKVGLVTQTKKNRTKVINREEGRLGRDTGLSRTVAVTMNKLNSSPARFCTENVSGQIISTGNEQHSSSFQSTGEYVIPLPEAEPEKLSLTDALFRKPTPLEEIEETYRSDGEPKGQVTRLLDRILQTVKSPKGGSSGSYNQESLSSSSSFPSLQSLLQTTPAHNMNYNGHGVPSLAAMKSAEQEMAQQAVAESRTAIPNSISAWTLDDIFPFLHNQNLGPSIRLFWEKWTPVLRSDAPRGKHVNFFRLMSLLHALDLIPMSYQGSFPSVEELLIDDDDADEQEKGLCADWNSGALPEGIKKYLENLIASTTAEHVGEASSSQRGVDYHYTKLLDLFVPHLARHTSPLMFQTLGTVPSSLSPSRVPSPAAGLQRRRRDIDGKGRKHNQVKRCIRKNTKGTGEYDYLNTEKLDKLRSLNEKTLSPENIKKFSPNLNVHRPGSPADAYWEEVLDAIPAIQEDSDRYIGKRLPLFVYPTLDDPFVTKVPDGQSPHKLFRTAEDVEDGSPECKIAVEHTSQSNHFAGDYSVGMDRLLKIYLASELTLMERRAQGLLVGAGVPVVWIRRLLAEQMMSDTDLKLFLILVASRPGSMLEAVFKTPQEAEEFFVPGTMRKYANKFIKKPLVDEEIKHCFTIMVDTNTKHFTDSGHPKYEPSSGKKTASLHGDPFTNSGSVHEQKLFCRFLVGEKEEERQVPVVPIDKMSGYGSSSLPTITHPYVNVLTKEYELQSMTRLHDACDDNLAATKQDLNECRKRGKSDKYAQCKATLAKCVENQRSEKENQAMSMQYKYAANAANREVYDCMVYKDELKRLQKECSNTGSDQESSEKLTEFANRLQKVKTDLKDEYENQIKTLSDKLEQYKAEYEALYKRYLNLDKKWNKHTKECKEIADNCALTVSNQTELCTENVSKVENSICLSKGVRRKAPEDFGSDKNADSYKKPSDNDANESSKSVLGNSVCERCPEPSNCLEYQFGNIFVPENPCFVTCSRCQKGYRFDDKHQCSICEEGFKSVIDSETGEVTCARICTCAGMTSSNTPRAGGKCTADGTCTSCAAGWYLDPNDTTRCAHTCKCAVRRSYMSWVGMYDIFKGTQYEFDKGIIDPQAPVLESAKGGLCDHITGHCRCEESLTSPDAFIFEVDVQDTTEGEITDINGDGLKTNTRTGKALSISIQRYIELYGQKILDQKSGVHQQPDPGNEGVASTLSGCPSCCPFKYEPKINNRKECQVTYLEFKGMAQRKYWMWSCVVRSEMAFKGHDKLAWCDWDSALRRPKLGNDANAATGRCKTCPKGFAIDPQSTDGRWCAPCKCGGWRNSAALFGGTCDVSNSKFCRNCAKAFGGVSNPKSNAEGVCGVLEICGSENYELRDTSRLRRQTRATADGQEHQYVIDNRYICVRKEFVLRKGRMNTNVFYKVGKDISQSILLWEELERSEVERLSAKSTQTSDVDTAQAPANNRRRRSPTSEGPNPLVAHAANAPSDPSSKGSSENLQPPLRNRYTGDSLEKTANAGAGGVVVEKYHDRRFRTFAIKCPCEISIGIFDDNFMQSYALTGTGGFSIPRKESFAAIWIILGKLDQDYNQRSYIQVQDVDDKPQPPDTELDVTKIQGKDNLEKAVFKEPVLYYKNWRVFTIEILSERTVNVYRDGEQEPFLSRVITKEEIEDTSGLYHMAIARTGDDDLLLQGKIGPMPMYNIPLSKYLIDSGIDVELNPLHCDITVYSYKRLCMCGGIAHVTSNFAFALQGGECDSETYKCTLCAGSESVGSSGNLGLQPDQDNPTRCRACSSGYFLYMSIAGARSCRPCNCAGEIDQISDSQLEGPFDDEMDSSDKSALVSSDLQTADDAHHGICDSLTGVCLKCPPGHYRKSRQATECTACKCAGVSSQGEAKLGGECKFGTGECLSCPIGNYVSYENTGQCNACKCGGVEMQSDFRGADLDVAGYSYDDFESVVLDGGTCSAGDGTCASCPAGTYKRTPLDSECTPCTCGGLEDPSGSSHSGGLIPVVGGKCDTDGGACLSCPKGYYRTKDSTECSRCMCEIEPGQKVAIPGGQCEPEGGQCLVCPPGYWRGSGIDKTQCKLCGCGMDGDAGGECDILTGYCSNCPSGYYRDSALPTKCTSCKCGGWKSEIKYNTLFRGSAADKLLSLNKQKQNRRGSNSASGTKNVNDMSVANALPGGECELHSGVCTMCPPGYYIENRSTSQMCKMCTCMGLGKDNKLLNGGFCDFTTGECSGCPRGYYIKRLKLGRDDITETTMKEGRKCKPCQCGIQPVNTLLGAHAYEGKPQASKVKGASMFRVGQGGVCNPTNGICDCVASRTEPCSGYGGLNHEEGEQGVGGVIPDKPLCVAKDFRRVSSPVLVGSVEEVVISTNHELQCNFIFETQADLFGKQKTNQQCQVTYGGHYSKCFQNSPEWFVGHTPEPMLPPKPDIKDYPPETHTQCVDETFLKKRCETVKVTSEAFRKAEDNYLKEWQRRQKEFNMNKAGVFVDQSSLSNPLRDPGEWLLNMGESKASARYRKLMSGYERTTSGKSKRSRRASKANFRRDGAVTVTPSQRRQQMVI